ncbi:MAG: aspartate/glutamate racemase family protein [Egibacteraceae bacterium]
MSVAETLPRGRPFYGVDVGIVLLDTDLPRPHGDVGNATSFDFPVAYEVARAADPETVVERGADGLLGTVVEAAERLIATGVRGVATCCGFLAIFQQELAAKLPVPVATSSLLQVPQVLTLLSPRERVAVLTASGRGLDNRHLSGVGISAADAQRLTIVGLEHTDHFYPVIIEGRGDLDVGRAHQQVVDTAQAAVRRDPDIAAFVFECTNLPPYSEAVRRVTGRPVWDAVSLIRWLHQAVAA